jgi:hypothetical protein
MASKIGFGQVKGFGKSKFGITAMLKGSKAFGGFDKHKAMHLSRMKLKKVY